MYKIYKGSLGYYVLTETVGLAYDRGVWKTFRDPMKPQWRWIAVDLATRARAVSELELLVMTGTSKAEIEERIKQESNGPSVQKCQ